MKNIIYVGFDIPFYLKELGIKSVDKDKLNYILNERDEDYGISPSEIEIRAHCIYELVRDYDYAIIDIKANYLIGEIEDLLLDKGIEPLYIVECKKERKLLKVTETNDIPVGIEYAKRVFLVNRYGGFFKGESND